MVPALAVNTWQGDHKCSAISASTFNAMCADTKANRNVCVFALGVCVCVWVCVCFRVCVCVSVCVCVCQGGRYREMCVGVGTSVHA